MATTVLLQVDFYKEFLMGRKSFSPQDFGVDKDRGEFDDLMVEEFGNTYRGMWTVDEMLLHPREAARFCEDVRRKHGFFDLPDDIMLRVIMQRRKNPASND